MHKNAHFSVFAPSKNRKSPWNRDIFKNWAKKATFLAKNRKIKIPEKSTKIHGRYFDGIVFFDFFGPKKVKNRVFQKHDRPLHLPSQVDQELQKGHFGTLKNAQKKTLFGVIFDHGFPINPYRVPKKDEKHEFSDTRFLGFSLKKTPKMLCRVRSEK